MWIYLALGLVGAGGVFFGLWQMARANLGLQRADTQEKRANDIEERLAVVDVTMKAEVARYEALVVELKHELQDLETAFNESAPPDALRARLRELLSSAETGPGPSGVPEKPTT